MFRTFSNGHSPGVSNCQCTGEYIWSFVSLPDEATWFYASFSITSPNMNTRQETMLLSSVAQVIELFRKSWEAVKVSQLILVSPKQINKSSGWLMEPLVEIWSGRHPVQCDNVFIFTLADGRQYFDSPHSIKHSDLRDLECLVSLPAHDRENRRARCQNVRGNREAATVRHT